MKTAILIIAPAAIGIMLGMAIASAHDHFTITNRDRVIDSLNCKVEKLDSLYKEKKVEVIRVIETRDSIQVKYKNIYVKNRNDINTLNIDNQIKLLSRNLSEKSGNQ